MARVDSQQILSGDIVGTLRQMTAPMIWGLLSTFLFGAVDTYFVSLLGTVELAAISFTFPVTFTITSTLIGFGIATSVVLARALGRRETDEARLIASSSILLGVLMVVVLASIARLLFIPLFSAMGASQEAMPLILDYVGIWMLAVPLMAVPMIGNAAIRATGDTKWPSLLMVFSGLVNVLLDPILIFGFGPVPAMGVKGAALATAIAWLLGMLAGLYILVVRDKLLTLRLGGWASLRRQWGRISTTAMPIVAANMLTPIANAVLTALVARYGDVAVAAFGAGSRIESISLVVCFALTSALSPFLAQNLGANQWQRADRALSVAIRFALCFQFSMYVLLALAAPWLAGLFSEDPEVIRLTRWYLWLMPLGACAYAAIMMMNTAFNSEGHSNNTLLSNLARLAVCVIPCAWLGSSWFGVLGFFGGAVIGNFIALSITYKLLRAMHSRRPVYSTTVDSL